MGYSKEELDSLNEAYDNINRRMNKAHRFIMLGYKDCKTLIDYGCGPAVAMMEVHTLSVIATHPGITTAEIQRLWDSSPTLSAVSQNVNKLLKKGLIRQEKFENDDKKKGLYVTELGEELHIAHIQYDIRSTENLMRYLKQSATEEELDAFFKVVGLWGNLLLQKKLNSEKCS